nr:MAG TPA: hypothetical protein [Caudoviricetes sp.]
MDGLSVRRDYLNYIIQFLVALSQKMYCYMAYHITTAKKKCEFLLDT